MIYEFHSYKEALKHDLQAKRPKGISLRKISENLSVQYTYLSKVLSSDKGHLSDDQIWLFGKSLLLREQEIEFLILLKNYELTQRPERREILEKRIQSIQQKHSLEADPFDFSNSENKSETNYLLNPYCVLLYTSLHIAEYRKNLIQLQWQMNVSKELFSQSLRSLEELDLVKMNNKKDQILSVKPAHLHFGIDHPLVRVHQSLFRQIINAKLLSLSDENKKNFMVTIASDHSSYEKINLEFQSFIKKVEQISIKSQPRHIYQLNFDFFKWF